MSCGMNETGSAPNFSWVESSFADSWVKPPLMMAGPTIADLIAGAVTTSLSSTIATARLPALPAVDRLVVDVLRQVGPVGLARALERSG